MSPRLILSLAVALALPVQPALAAPAPRAVAESELQRLVVLLVPEQAIVDMASQAVAQGIDEGDAAKDFARYPGMRATVLAQMRPQFDRTIRDSLPSLRADIAKVLAGGLTSGDISELLVFFESPTGRKLYTLTFATLAANTMQDDEAIKKAAFDKVMASLSPEDYGPLAAFGASESAQKLQALQPQVREASAAWTNRLIAANGAPLRTQRDKAIAEYKRQHPEVRP